jgi:hypothetical protein
MIHIGKGVIHWHWKWSWNLVCEVFCTDYSVFNCLPVQCCKQATIALSSLPALDFCDHNNEP